MHRSIAIFITNLNVLTYVPGGVDLGTNFRERRRCEVRRIYLLRGSVNRRSVDRVKTPFWIFCTVAGCVRSVG
jgi:hypothetical protein